MPVVSDYTKAGPAIESRNEFGNIHLTRLVDQDEVEQAQLKRKDRAEVLDLGGPEWQSRQRIGYLHRSEQRLKARRLTEEEDLLETLQVREVFGRLRESNHL